MENLNYDVADNHGHVPVMRERMADLLRPQVETAGDNAVLVDATLGAGGHTRYFLEAFPNVRVIGVDRDQQALRNATERLAPYGDRFIGVNARFDELG
ncbi:16S rRNA (cytosine(1402)-N(4))-methyltransferase, partial [Corynebacterium sp.]